MIQTCLGLGAVVGLELLSNVLDEPQAADKVRIRPHDTLDAVVDLVLDVVNRSCSLSSLSSWKPWRHGYKAITQRWLPRSL